MFTTLLETESTSPKCSVQYRVLTRISEIRAIERSWNQILETTGCTRAFSSPEWYISSFLSDKSISPWLVLALAGNEIVGILPLAKGKSAALEFPNFLSDYSDAIVTGDDPALTAELLTQALTQVRHDERIVLSRLRNDSACVKAMPLLEEIQGVDATFKETSTYLYTDTSGKYEGFLASKSRIMRKGINRAERKARDAGIDIVKVGPTDLSPGALPDAFLNLVLTRHTGKSIFRSEQGRTFTEQVLPVLFALGRLQVFAAISASRIVAMDLCMVGRNSLCTWNGGFLDEAAFFSPGTVLTAFAIRSAMETGCDDYDFLRGDEEYKNRWATGSRPVGELALFRS